MLRLGHIIIYQYILFIGSRLSLYCLPLTALNIILYFIAHHCHNINVFDFSNINLKLNIIMIFLILTHPMVIFLIITY